MAPTAGTRLRFKKAQSKKPFQKQKKIPSLKNRIRALERFLKRDNLEPETRAAKEEELKQLSDERDEKERIEEEKKNAEKYKKPRFFERVKLMRKLKQSQSQLEKATDKAEKRKLTAESTKYRQDLMYIFYYPKAEQYISLFPAKPLSEELQQRRNELREAAIARFEKENPEEAFHKFCYADGQASNSSSSNAAALLVKKPTKEEEKKKKKPRRNKDKDDNAQATVKKQRVLADEDNVDEGGPAEGSDGEEDDDFFL